MRLRSQAAPRRSGDVASCYAILRRLTLMDGRPKRDLDEMLRGYAWAWVKNNPAGYVE